MAQNKKTNSTASSVPRIKCLRCESIISKCVECGHPFENGDKISCIADGSFHRCQACVEEI